MKYTQKELEKDLLSKMNGRFFTATFAGGNYKRRTFKTLLQYYKVTPRKLFKAMLNVGLEASYCTIPIDIIWAKWRKRLSSRDRWTYEEKSTLPIRSKNKYFTGGKFTPDYFDKLFNSINNIK